MKTTSRQQFEIVFYGFLFLVLGASVGYFVAMSQASAHVRAAASLESSESREFVESGGQTRILRADVLEEKGFAGNVTVRVTNRVGYSTEYNALISDDGEDIVIKDAGPREPLVRKLLAEAVAK